MSHFLGQVTHESINFQKFEEGWSYSEINLLKTFGCRSKKINGKWVKQWDYI